MDTVEIRPGATYALVIEQSVTREIAEQIRNQWLESAPTGAQAMILSGIQLTELTDEDLLKLGLQRIPA